ncbi:MAG: ATP-binding protein [Myxococcota bacterium]
MYDIVKMAAADVRPLRNPTSAHPFDALPSAVHLGACREGQLVGVVSALPVDPTEDGEPRRRVVLGPFGEARSQLRDAIEAACPGLRLWTDLSEVRRRPGMYIGRIEDAERLAVEAIDNVLDEHVAGHATELVVTVEPDGSVRIADDGRGIPPAAVVQVCLELHRTRSWDGHEPHVHLQPQGMGLAVVNALSAWLVVESRRAGVHTSTVFSRGRLLQGPMEVGPSEETGTVVRFLPDPAIFRSSRLDLRPVLSRAAYLCPALHVVLNGEDLSQPDGLDALVRSWSVYGGAVERLEGGDDVRTVRIARDPCGAGPQRMWVNLTPVVEGDTLDVVRALHGDATLAIDVRHRDPQLDGRSGSGISDPALTVLLLELLGS